MNLIIRDSQPDADYLARLNAEQRRAALHGDGSVAGPLLVIAGAGSGKTNTLAHRVAHLIVNGADPRRILLLTFSRRAAGEMSAARRADRRRGARTEGDGAAAGADLGRHVPRHRRAAAARIRAAHRPRPGLHHPRPRGFRRPDEPRAPRARPVADREPLSRQGHLPCHLFARGQRARPQLDAGAGARLSLVRRLGERAARACSPPMSRPSRRRTCSTTTTCCSTGRRWLAEPSSPPTSAGRFDHVLVDEYQDTNRLQAAILLGLKPDGRGLTVVGDDAQSIYSFRAATVRNILDFPKQFSPPAPIVTLERNYRSTQPILAAANARDRPGAPSASPRTCGPSATAASSRRSSPSRDEADQARYVADARPGRPRGGHARSRRRRCCSAPRTTPARWRSNSTRRNIPFVKFGGLKFLDAAHVKDLLACCASPRTRATASPASACCSCCRASGRPRRQRVLDAIAEAADALARAARRSRRRRGPASDWPDFVAR